MRQRQGRVVEENRNDVLRAEDVSDVPSVDGDVSEESEVEGEENGRGFGEV